MQRAAEILDLVPYLARYPRQLSGGQRQRVAMGRAIVRDPAVFLFDEPLSNLDAKLRVQMRAEIKELHQRLKTTTVYVTHDQVEAMTMADRIVVMNDGVVEQVGHAARTLRPAGQSVRRGLHRLAGDEPAQGHDPRQRQAELRHRGGVALAAEHARPRAATAGRPSTASGPSISRCGGDGSRRRSRSSSRPDRKRRSSPSSAAHKIVGVFRERIAARPGEKLPIRPDAAAVHLFDEASGQRLN